MAMNLTIFLAIAVLGSTVVNLLHWRGRSDERFFYHPQSGWLRFAFNVWAVATIVSAVLFLLGLIPALAFVGVGMGLAIAQELYSIGRRHSQRVRL